MRSLAILAVALLAACAAAPRRDATPEVVLAALPTDSECQRRAALLRDWRDRLALRDWTLTLHCAPHPDYLDEADGAVEIFAEEREAEIWIHPAAADPQLIAVHELLHVIFEQVCQDGSELLEEQGLRVLARRIVERGDPR